MSLAAHVTQVYALATNATAGGSDEVAGLDSVKFSPKVDQLDVTDFKDTSGAKKRLGALSDGTMTGSGNGEFADAPQALIRSSMVTNASVWFTVHFNPSGSANQKGFKVETKISAYECDAAVAGKATFSFTAEFTGAYALE